MVGTDLSLETRNGQWVGISQMTKEEMSFADRRTSGLDNPSLGLCKTIQRFERAPVGLEFNQ